MKGRIFSIEEFSIFDGDGIRTTVFLKGCPLSCKWCHSPEGQSPKKQFLRSPNGCFNCGKCFDAGEKSCGERRLTKESIAACPRNLIRECGEDVDSDALVQRLTKNAKLLNMSGGGVTFSGGEPLMQHDFLLDCLKKLAGKVNRGLQTTGYTVSQKFSEIIMNTDLVLYDLKLIDCAEHKKYTGVTNERIIENYRRLASSGVKFITRMPFIPTVTDTIKNVTLACELMRECGVSYVEIMPYNKLAGSKYKLSGRVYEPGFDQNIDVNFRSEIFEKYGIIAKKI